MKPEKLGDGGGALDFILSLTSLLTFIEWHRTSSLKYLCTNLALL